MPATLGDNVPSNAGGVPGDASGFQHSEGAGRQRSERLRARRNAAGMAQVSGWVPKERRAYAREVIAALARGANSLPPDPEYAGAVEAARAETETARTAEVAARAALAEAEQREQELVAERDATRVRAEAAEQAQAEAAGALQAAKEATASAQAETRRFQGVPGLRGRVIRWLARDRTRRGGGVGGHSIPTPGGTLPVGAGE